MKSERNDIRRFFKNHLMRGTADDKLELTGQSFHDSGGVMRIGQEENKKPAGVVEGAYRFRIVTRR